LDIVQNNIPTMTRPLSVPYTMDTVQLIVSVTVP